MIIKLVSFLCLFFLSAVLLCATNVDIKKVELIRLHKGWAADVWLSHNDEGKRHYANWIEIRYDSDVKGGTRIVRRDIVSSTKDDRKRFFYRIYFDSIPEEATKLLVRGHCNVHSYGGKEVEIVLENKSGEDYKIKKKMRNFYRYPSMSGYRDFFRNPRLRKNLGENQMY